MNLNLDGFASPSPLPRPDPQTCEKGIDGMARYDDLPYRTCVGMMLINERGSFSLASRWRHRARR